MKRRLLVLAVAAAVVTGCSPADPAAGRWVESVRAAHAEADADASLAGDGALRRVLEAPVPESVSPEDARALRQDSAYRLGRRLLRRGEAPAAEEVADGALADPAMDVLTASLLVLRGEAREAQGELREAAADYHEALRVNERLLERALARREAR